MEYWEFLLQKEGDRSWFPLKSPRFVLETGRYRVVAHSNRPNTDVEICVTHTSTDEVPPKRRHQKRSRRTNPEGLMVIIPFTSLKPGLWELRCCGDVMSDFLGNSWQQAVQLLVVPKATDTLTADAPTSSLDLLQESGTEKEEQETEPAFNQTVATNLLVEQTAQIDSNENVITNSHSHPVETPEEPENLTNSPPLPLPPSPPLPLSPTLDVPEDDPIAEPNLSETEITSLTPITTQIEVQQSEIPIQNDDPTPTPVLKSATSAYNPILEESLEMLEQVLQQVLDPVIREFEKPDPPDSEDSVTPESDLPPETEPNWQGLIFTLDEESLMVEEGQLLTLSGQIDILNVDRLDNTKTITPSEDLFQGILRYELRHPQTAQVLLDVQKPLLAEGLPLIFSHTLEIPANCQSCLLLGKVTLYGSGARALASQPFTVTADLDQILGAIAPESEASLEENIDFNPSLKPNSQTSVSVVPQLDQTLLDLIDKAKSSQSIVFSSSSGQSLPPQLYQPDSSQQVSKSLDLPTFSKASGVESEPDSVEVKLDNLEEERSPNISISVEDSNPENTDTEQANQFSILSSPETGLTDELASEELSLNPQNQTEVNQEILSLPDSSAIPVANETTELPDAWISTPEDQLDISLTGELPETPQLKYSLTNVPISESNVKETAELDRAFHALNSDDRFWGRIHSLVEDTELSEWLKFELPLYENPDEEEATSEADFLVSEEEEITPSLNGDNDLADFDESIWDEETEQFGSVITDTAEVQLPIQNETNSVQSIPNPDWTAQEFVVDDDDESLPEPEPVGVRAKNSRLVHSAKRNGSQLENKSFSRSESGIPLPTPELFIPTNELAAGEPILVRVKLASHPDRLGVKLWVKDRQSRSLLDGPRWLMDLIPNGSGELEALTQLVVPFGTVEIRFEAIAIDLDSERESHKVMVDSIVIPPDLPSLSFEEFES